MGSDFINKEGHKVAAIISIHAPAWGATKSYAAGNVISGISIHAPAWGATTK